MPPMVVMVLHSRQQDSFRTVGGTNIEYWPRLSLEEAQIGARVVPCVWAKPPPGIGPTSG